jgi:hypothetical protein
MDRGISIMRSAYPTYEDAARDYLARLDLLTKPLQQPPGVEVRGGLELPADTLVQKAEEIIDASSGLLQLAQDYTNSADPAIREGIRFHFIDQATVELLLGIELLQVYQDSAAVPLTAALRANHSAALREAISAVAKSSAAPIKKELATFAACRASESATVEEAMSGLQLALESAAGGISRRVQELGSDIAFDLVAGMQWPEFARGASLSLEEINAIMTSTSPGVAERMLLQAYRKVAVLLEKDVADGARAKIGQWLDQVKQAGKIAISHALLESLYRVGMLRECVAGPELSALSLESINEACDLVKAFSDKGIVLISRMRKLEDAIRLAGLIEVPQFRLLTIALQVALLSTLLCAGQDYINNGLSGVLAAAQGADRDI